ncbi:DNA-processing protein DprA [bacterium]|nr:DNA-processing protein DprA [bacterium]
MHNISSDTQVVLMLCGVLPGAPVCDGTPLGAADFYRLARWLDGRKLSPSALLEADALREAAEGIIEHQVSMERLQTLLRRGAAIALACERWLQMGLWIISPYDKSYPPRLRERLAEKSSPLLFGAGNLALLNEGGIAVVGSRNADEAAQEFAVMVGEKAAGQRVPIISGGARGVDAASMRGAIEHGGNVVGVLAHNLAREAVAPESREFLQDGRLVLLTPVSPEAPFHAGYAMARNKYIYTLADYAVVVSSDYGSGGTWSGAQENLKHAWCPLFVRDGDGLPEGNSRLMKRGAVPMQRSVLESGADLLVWFESNSPAINTNEQGSLFSGGNEQ